METLTLSEEIELQDCGVRFEPLGLIMPEDLQYDQWSKVGHKLSRTSHVLNWWIGDWAAFGDRKYGQLKQFAEVNGINYQSLRDASWVSGSIPLSRRRDNLEWSFHREVAALKPAEQSRWLERAVTERPSVGEFRKQIRTAKGEVSALESEGPSIEMGTKYWDDLLDWMQKQPKEFWTKERKKVWLDRIKQLAEAIPG